MLLFEFPNSPFYSKFLETGKAGGYSSGYGFEASIKYPIFNIGLKNINRN